MRITKPALKLLTCAVVVSMLSGCFLYLPHHKMKIVDKADTVAFSVFTGPTVTSVDLYCQRADNTINLWQQFATVSFNGGIADKKKNIVRTGYVLETVPASCWSPLSNNNATKNFATLIRIGSDGNWGTVSKNGMRCLGELFGTGKLATYESCGRFDSSNQPNSVITLFSKL